MGDHQSLGFRDPEKAFGLETSAHEALEFLQAFGAAALQPIPQGTDVGHQSGGVGDFQVGVEQADFDLSENLFELGRAFSRLKRATTWPDRAWLGSKSRYRLSVRPCGRPRW